MAENIGIVVKTELNDYAQVLLGRKSACGGCQPTGGGCRSCLTSANKMQSRVANPLGARAGDLVKVGLSSRNLFIGAAILYLIPIGSLLVGAFTGSWVASTLDMAEMLGSIVGVICGLVLGFVAVALIDRSSGIRSRITPVITGIVTPNIGLPNHRARIPVTGPN
jgi:sigma-E factor negative regulatory protein RseC